ncbi:MAG: hypothetical protein ABIL42_00695 [candidate division WOR-3 bacterium]
MFEYFKRVRWIFYFSLVGTIGALLLSSFLVKPVYERGVILVPSLEEITQLQPQTLLFFQLSRGAMSSPAQIFVDIATSYNFKREFIERYNLLEILGTKNIDDAVQIMDSKFQLEPLPSGSFMLSVRDTDKDRARELTQKYIDFLNEKANLTLNAKGRELRRFLEKRLKEVEDSIKLLQDSITAFEEREKILVPSAEDMVAPAIGGLITKIVQKEVELSTLMSVFSENIPDVRIVRREIDALMSNLSSKFEHLPKNLRKAYEYRVRLTILSTVYGTLYEEYEKAKLLEKKDNPFLQPASEPLGKEKRVWPKRVIPTLASFIAMSIGMFFMLTCFIIFDKLRDTEFGRLVLQIRRDLGL